MDEFFDVVPGGRLTVAALGLLALPGVRRQLRPVAKAALRAGLAVTDQMKGFVAEAREQTSDLIAEVRSERDEHVNGATEPDTASPRRGKQAAPVGAAQG